LRVAIQDVSKAYGFFWALKDINLQFHPGECVALLGPNGAGKTTLLKIVSALLQRTTGEIELDGEKLTSGSSPLRSNIGFLSPKDHLYENLTVRENLRFFNALHRKRKDHQKMDQALEKVGLVKWSDHYLSSLSSGMRCRLAIAKSLLLEPKLLLLDEPYGVLDGSGIDLLESYLKQMCDAGKIVIMATHHVSRVLTLCSRAIILHQGRIIFDEPRQEPWENFYRVFGEFLPRGERWSS
jgi:heme ABC exporter ATP-binding subunit CcmA